MSVYLISRTSFLPSISSLLSYRLQISHAVNECKAEVASAESSLKSVVEPARLRRAAVKAAEERVRDIWEGLEAVRKANEASE